MPPAFLIDSGDFHFHPPWDLSELCARGHLLEKTYYFGIFPEKPVTKKGTPVTKRFLSNSGHFRGGKGNRVRFGFLPRILGLRHPIEF
jgi:hypothetical protein